jgi:hypothetical protein
MRILFLQAASMDPGGLVEEPLQASNAGELI